MQNNNVRKEAARAMARTWGSLSQTAARLAKQVNMGARVVAQKRKKK